jgi:hypothetical protein
MVCRSFREVGRRSWEDDEQPGSNRLLSFASTGVNKPTNAEMICTDARSSGAMPRGRTKNPCSEELQRFRGPLHRRISVQHRNRICRKSSGSSCKSVRLATRSADHSGCETAQIFSSWDRWDNTGIREPPNYSPETDKRNLPNSNARIWRRGGDYIASFFATLLFSVTSFVKPAFSAVYERVSAVSSVSAMPSRLSYGHRKCPKKVT